VLDRHIVHIQLRELQATPAELELSRKLSRKNPHFPHPHELHARVSRMEFVSYLYTAKKASDVHIQPPIKGCMSSLDANGNASPVLLAGALFQQTRFAKQHPRFSHLRRFTQYMGLFARRSCCLQP